MPEKHPKTSTSDWKGWLWWCLCFASFVALAYPALWRTPNALAWVSAGLLSVVLALRLRHWRRIVPPRRVGWSIAGWGVSIILTLVLSEAVARIYLDAFDVGGKTPVVPHPELIWALEPGRTGTRPILLNDFTVGTERYSISSQGLRSEPVPPKRPGEFRIALVGDSFTFGKGLQDDETIARQLHTLLEKAYPDRIISVVNAGCGGYAPWQELGFFVERALPLQPDLVFFQFHPPNDIQGTLLKVGMAPEAYPQLDVAYAFIIRATFTDTRARADRLLHNVSYLYRFIFQRSEGSLRISRLVDHLRLYPEPVIPLPPSAPRPPHIEVYRREWDAPTREGWTMVREDIAELQQVCKNNGIALLGYSIPYSGAIDAGFWQSATQEHGGERVYRRELEETVVEPMFRQLDLPYVDVVDALRKHGKVNELYYVYDGHLTPDGARVVAETLAGALAPFLSHSPDSD